MERKPKQQKKENLRTFKIYKHIDKLAKLKQQKQTAASSKDIITDNTRLQ